MFFTKNISDLNNREMQPGQTLFQYLKRKKHIALKQSLENSFLKTDIKPKELTIIKQTQKPLKDTEVKQSARQGSTKRRSKKSSNKKKKVDQSIDSRKENHSELSNLCQDIFKQQKTTRRSFINSSEMIFEQKNEPVVKKTPARSFMSMISPLKNQASLSLSHTKTGSLNNTQERKSSNKMAQFCSKKMIKQAMTKVQRYYHDQVDFESQIKEKLRQFFIMLNSVLIQFEDFSGSSISDGLEKKMKQLRSSMKLINGFVSNRQPKEKQHVIELIESVYASVNQVIDSFQGQVKSQSQSNCQSIITRKKQEYQNKIEELTKQKNSLNRQIGAVIKQSQKLEREYDKLLQKFNKLQEQFLSKAHTIQQEEKAVFQAFEQKIQDLTEQNSLLNEKVDILSKKLKDSQFKFQEYSRRINIQHQQKLNERQNYLIKQINLLKSQCATDIKNLNAYYTKKQQHYPNKIKDLQNIISDQSITIVNLQNALKDTQNLAKLQQVNVKQSKTKVNEVMLDLYRINQELYKHWLALKDVKTLLSRLNMFEKFERIYKDIPFDDVLFLP